MKSEREKSIIFIVPYPQGEAPSQRFRFEQYIPLLEANGFKIHFAPFLDSQTWSNLYKEGGVIKKASGILKSFLRRVITILTIHRYDYVFIHREASHLGPPIFEFIIAKIFRKAYIYDFDDAIWLANYETRMIPGAGKAMKDVDIDDDAFKHIEAIIHSMTPLERSVPTTIDTNRKKRIAKGSGTSVQQINQLLKQFQQMSKMMKMRYSFEFRVISNEKPDYDLKSLNFIKWNSGTEIHDLNQI